MAFDSGSDYKEAMAQAHKADFKTTDTQHKKQHNPILKQAGLSKGKRKKFREKNPEVDALYQQTYKNIDDKALRENFKSKDKNVIAAMAIATQRMAKESGLAPQDYDQIDEKTIEKSNFKALYKQAKEDVDNGLVDTQKPDKYLSATGVEELDNAKAKAVANKNFAAKNKKNIITTAVPCDKEKVCELTAFKISKTDSKDTTDYLPPLPLDETAGGLKDSVNEVVANELGEFKLDLLNSPNTVDELHVVGGHFDDFKSIFKVEAQGVCGHGEAANCPGVEVYSDNANVADTQKTTAYFKNSDPKLKTLRLNPGELQQAETLNYAAMLGVLRRRIVPEPASYNFKLTSCSASGAEVYSGFNPVIVVHPTSIIRFALKIEFDKKPRKPLKIKPKVEFVARLDNKNYKLERNIPTSYTDIVADVLDNTAIVEVMEEAAQWISKFKAVTSSDQCSDQTEESVVGDATLLNPCINIAYTERAVNNPQLGFSEIGFVKKRYISGSPLFKYESTSNLFNLLWRYGLRAGLAAHTLGMSEVALKAIDYTGVREVAEEKYDDLKEYIRCMVVNVTQGEVFKTITDKARQAKEFTLALCDLDDKDVSTFLSNPKTRGTCKCVLKISMAAETDDPASGLVWTKGPNDDSYQYDSDASGCYAGLNFSIEGEIAHDLQFLQAIAIPRGVKAEVKSADRTGEVRFGVTFKHGQEEDKDRKPIGSSGLCRQFFFSGAGVFIEAMYWTGMTGLGGGDENDNLTDENNVSEDDDFGLVGEVIESEQSDSIAVGHPLKIPLFPESKGALQRVSLFKNNISNEE